MASAPEGAFNWWELADLDWRARILDAGRAFAVSEARSGFGEGGVEDGNAYDPLAGPKAGQSEAGLEEGFFDGGAACQLAVERLGEEAGVGIENGEAHPQGIGDLLADEGCREIA